MDFRKIDILGSRIGIGSVFILGSAATFAVVSTLVGSDANTIPKRIAVLFCSIFAGVGYGLVSHSLYSYERKMKMPPILLKKRKINAIFVGEMILGNMLAALNPAILLGVMKKKDPDLVGGAYGAGALVSSLGFLILTKAIQLITRYIILRKLEEDENTPSTELNTEYERFFPKY